MLFLHLRRNFAEMGEFTVSFENNLLSHKTLSARHKKQVCPNRTFSVFLKSASDHILNSLMSYSRSINQIKTLVVELLFGQ